MPSFYSLLQVDPRAEQEVIDGAYRRLAAKYHPDVDRSPGATERMKLINAAYEVLSDPQKRRAYDSRWGNSQQGHRESRPEAASQHNLSEWLMTAGLSILMVVVTTYGSRFGLRMLLPLAVLFLLVWLLMAWRKR